MSIALSVESSIDVCTELFKGVANGLPHRVIYRFICWRIRRCFRFVCQVIYFLSMHLAIASWQVMEGNGRPWHVLWKSQGTSRARPLRSVFCVCARSRPNSGASRAWRKLLGAWGASRAWRRVQCPSDELHGTIQQARAFRRSTALGSQEEL